MSSGHRISGLAVAIGAERGHARLGRREQPMYETPEDAYRSHCPICNGLLDIDQEVGYVCPDCGWDASFELDGKEVWIVPDDRDSKARS
jgi:hypothetical protein